MYVMMNGLGQTAAQAGAVSAEAAAAPTKTTTVWEDILKAVPSVLDKVKDVLVKKPSVETPPPPPTYQPPPPPRTPGWVAPVAIGGGIVVLGVGTYALVRALGKRRR